MMIVFQVQSTDDRGELRRRIVEALPEAQNDLSATVGLLMRAADLFGTVHIACHDGRLTIRLSPGPMTRAEAVELAALAARVHADIAQAFTGDPRGPELALEWRWAP